MTPELHPGLDELLLYCTGTPDAEDGSANDQIRRHVQSCAECRAQVDGLCAEMALMAMSVPQVAPPATAKARLMKAVADDLTQNAVPADTVVTSNPATTDETPSNVVPMKPRRHSPGLIWGGWVAAAACLFYAVQLREANRGMRQQLQTETAQLIQSNSIAAGAAHVADVRAASAARAEEVLDVLSSPQSQRVTLVSAHAKPEPTGHAVYLKSRGALVFTASNLHPLPPHKTYELWVIPANGAAPIPAGTFQPNPSGMASVLLPKLPAGVAAKAFGVTMENSGGATTPTMPILLAGG